MATSLCWRTHALRSDQNHQQVLYHDTIIAANPDQALHHIDSNPNDKMMKYCCKLSNHKLISELIFKETQYF